MKYIPKPALNAWTKQRIGMTIGGPFKDVDFAQWFTGTRASIIRALQENGGRILAGSDSPQAFLVVGFALHEELEALQAAGLTPAQALAAATRNPAAYFATLANKGSALGIAPDFGVIDQG